MSGGEQQTLPTCRRAEYDFLALNWSREFEGRNMRKEREEDESKISTD